MRALFRVSSLVLFLGLAASAFAGANYTNIENMGGWQSCSACAGAGGSGSVAAYSMFSGVSSPSLDGSSAQFNLGGSHPYSDALWWRQLGGNSSAHHFVYDLYFYVKNSSAVQALEFDVNQAVGGHKYIFGTECDIRNTHTWKVWDTKDVRWISTGIGCAAPPAYKWNHLTWELERTSNNMVHFIALTLNGVKHYVNRYYYPENVSANMIDVAFQMDGNYQQAHYSVWLDKVALSYY